MQTDERQIPRAKVTCAWCQKVITEGTEPISHGLCRECYERELASLVKEPLIAELVAAATQAADLIESGVQDYAPHAKAAARLSAAIAAMRKAGPK